MRTLSRLAAAPLTPLGIRFKIGLEDFIGCVNELTPEGDSLSSVSVSSKLEPVGAVGPSSEISVITLPRSLYCDVDEAEVSRILTDPSTGRLL